MSASPSPGAVRFPTWRRAAMVGLAAASFGLALAEVGGQPVRSVETRFSFLEADHS